MREVLVTIERMCYGAAGFGRVEGKACFVPFTAPGDQVRIRVVKEKRSFLEGEVLEVMVPSKGPCTTDRLGAGNGPGVKPFFGFCRTSKPVFCNLARSPFAHVCANWLNFLVD